MVDAGQKDETRPLLQSAEASAPGGSTYSAAVASMPAGERTAEEALSAEAEPTPHQTKGSKAWEGLRTLSQTVTRRIEHQLRTIDNSVEDTMTYRAQSLGQWSSLAATALTVWRRKNLWQMALKLFILSIFIGVLTICVVKDPAALKAGKFMEISKFLNVFVGLLLGFFMSASVNRWWSCVDGFLQLFDTIRNIQMHLVALGVQDEKIDTCLRYGVLSAWILTLQLRYEKSAWTNNEEANESENASRFPTTVAKDSLEDMWTALAAAIEFHSALLKIYPEEAEALKKCEDPSSMTWIWISSYMGRMGQDGDIPGMSTPTWGRMMQLVSEAHGGIRTVRSSITVQAPFIYVQMLSTLVHINNIINAISFGLTLGTALGTILTNLRAMFFTGQKATISEAANDAQCIVVSFFFSCFGPFIYQALLETSICIAQPFDGRDGEIPTWRLLKRLERDLIDAKMMAGCVGWDRPYFKMPP